MPQQKKNNSFLSHSAYIFFYRFFNSLSSLLVMYIFAHNLSMGQYGHYQAFWIQSNIFNVFLGAGLTLLAFTYPTDKVIRLMRNLKPAHLLFYLVLLLLAAWLFGRLQEKNGIQGIYSWGFLLLFAFSNLFDAFLIAFRKYRPLILFNFFYALIFLLLHIYFISGDFTLNRLLAFLMPLLGLKLLFTGIVIYKAFKSRKQVSEEALGSEPTPASKSMRNLWLHLYLYDIIQISFIWIDKFLVSVLLDPVDTAIYVNGALNIPFLPILFSALASGALLHLSTNKSTAVRLQTVNQVGRILSAVAFPLFLFFLFFSREFVVVFFSEKYLASVPVFICSILILPFKAYSYTVILQHLEKGRIINLGAILDLILALMLMYPMYKLLGLPGLALCFVISTAFQALFYLYFTHKLLGVSILALLPLGNWTLKILGFGLLTGVLYLTLPGMEQPLLTVLVAGSVSGLIALGVLYWETRRVRRPEG